MKKSRKTLASAPGTWSGLSISDDCGKDKKLDLHSGGPLRQNYSHVILGGEGVAGAPLHPVAGAGPVPRIRPRDLLPREGWFLARGQADLLGLSGKDRMSELCAP